MDISKNEKILLTVFGSFLLIGIITLSSVILLDYFNKKNAPFIPAQPGQETVNTGNVGNVDDRGVLIPPASCGDGVCDEDERDICPIDCLGGSVHITGESEVTIDDDILMIAQTFRTGVDEMRLSKFGFYFVPPTLGALEMSLYEGITDDPDDGELIVEKTFGPFSSMFANYLYFDEDSITLKSNTAYSVVIKPIDNDQGRIRLQYNMDRNVFPSGKMFVYGKLYDPFGELLDETEEWRQRDGTLQFLKIYWGDKGENE